MLGVIKSVLGSDDPVVVDLVRSLATEDETRILLSEQERSVFDWLLRKYEDHGVLGNAAVFGRDHPELVSALASRAVTPPDGIAFEIQDKLAEKRRHRDSADIMRIAVEIGEKGVTFDLAEKLHSYQAKVDESLDEELTLRELYDRGVGQSLGISTGIEEIDAVIHGIAKGYMGCIFAYTGGFKSTFAVNMFYRNSYLNGYNQLLVSLEIPKVDVWWNLLSLHSGHSKWGRSPISHDRIRTRSLDPDEVRFLFDEVEPDLKNSRGKMCVLDETDFKTQSFGEIRALVEMVDKDMDYGLDTIYWDHVGLFKYVESWARGMGVGDVINKYVSFIRQLGIRFCRDKDNPTEWRQLTNVILVQANRQGYIKASRDGGRYNLQAIAESNEVERASSFIIAVYTNEDMKLSGEASVQLLKSRYGETRPDPISVQVDPVHYRFGETLSTTFSVDGDTMFDALMSDSNVDDRVYESVNLDEFNV